ncbi:glycoside hydrolase family 97 protein [Flavobacteriaceae bacterium F89]|uniref:Glycoside hydrolase family 97 protein n=1 Tax=Cerina litoralis TaxID=2874477 RepID=A0AAE3ERQ8_9FLAO|nr:glycoside hydrolase family 97 protein [Cerina litoralis]MCG2459160.1 glycoside hydrolase family 97 protein [Cerina litoralis]
MKTPLFFFALIFSLNLQAQDYEIASPDKNLKLKVHLGDKIAFSIYLNDKEIIANSTMNMDIEGHDTFGESPKIKRKHIANASAELHPVVALKRKNIEDSYQELTLDFKGNYALVFRAYNDGAAYRFVTNINKEVVVNHESFTLSFAGETQALFPKEDSMLSHNERLYLPTKLDTLNTDTFCSLPILTKVNGANVLFTETDLSDYPGMFLFGTMGNALTAGFPHHVKEAKPAKNGGDRNQILTYDDFLAKTSGKRNYPWRVMIITDDDKQLLESTLVYQLSATSKLQDTDWIKPGKVAWDWYNANNIYGVDFKSGLKTETYKYYIDFASEYGLEYIILDEGWSKSTTQIDEPNPDIDIKELVDYGEQKKVGVILWTLWGPLDHNFGILDRYKSWGVKGIKVDFMQRSDQYMVDYLEQLAAAAAKRHLLVDYHGTYKPSGLERMYPNVINFEGVKGNENNKWSHEITPEHTVTIPFTRMVSGPMDFTPGAMVNAHLINHNISFDRPMALGTRCHQLAMYVVYESPLQMLCDSPSVYYKEPETTGFIAQIPTVWDETKILDAKVADYVLLARKKDDVWFVGAMTDNTPREMTLDLSFLESGQYVMEVMKDGINADRFAQDYVHEKVEVSSGDRQKIKLASGGGWAAIITKK